MLLEPFAHFVRKGADVGGSDGGDVRGKGAALRVEETLITRIGIGTADESDFGEVMSRHLGFDGCDVGETLLDHACDFGMQLLSAALEQ